MAYEEKITIPCASGTLVARSFTDKRASADGFDIEVVTPDGTSQQIIRIVSTPKGISLRVSLPQDNLAKAAGYEVLSPDDPAEGSFDSELLGIAKMAEEISTRKIGPDFPDDDVIDSQLSDKVPSEPEIEFKETVDETFGNTAEELIAKLENRKPFITDADDIEPAGNIAKDADGIIKDTTEANIGDTAEETPSYEMAGEKPIAEEPIRTEAPYDSMLLTEPVVSKRNTIGIDDFAVEEPKPTASGNDEWEPEIELLAIDKDFSGTTDNDAEDEQKEETISRLRITLPQISPKDDGDKQ